VYRGLLTQLNVPGFIPVLCAHEVAHMIYFGAAGAKSFEPVPTTIRYGTQIDDYVGDLVAIQLKDLRSWEPGKFWDWFSNIARAHVAGGVVARKLMPSSDGGDQNDKDRFRLLCDQLNADPKMSIKWKEVWKKAQESVLEDLKNPEFIKVIEQQARDLRPALGL
jgi:hypothetical protein